MPICPFFLHSVLFRPLACPLVYMSVCAVSVHLTICRLSTSLSVCSSFVHQPVCLLSFRYSTWEDFHRQAFSVALPWIVGPMARRWSRTCSPWSSAGRTSTTACCPSSWGARRTGPSWPPSVGLQVCYECHGCTWKKDFEF